MNHGIQMHYVHINVSKLRSATHRTAVCHGLESTRPLHYRVIIRQSTAGSTTHKVSYVQGFVCASQDLGRNVGAASEWKTRGRRGKHGGVVE